MSRNEKQYFLKWEESANSAITEVGGKGQNLGRLNSYGFLVPAGGVLAARAYLDFLKHNNLTGSIHAAGAIRAEEALENEEMLGEIRRKINEGRMPDTIRQELAEQLAGMGLLDKPVAVRSSATAEDSSRASFAGMHESFLNVTGLELVVQAIKGCYASLWTPRAVSYRRKMGFGDDEVAAAVVIMELVPAVASGVAFSCDPRTGRRDRIPISANFGLGESVVSGAIDPDEYLLQPMAELPEIVENKIGSKKKYTRLVQSGGTELVSAGSEENGDKRPVLNDNQIIELGSLTLRVFEALGKGVVNQDMEWAFDGKKFHVGSQFRKEFEEFLKDYGHRGVYEAELLNPRWGEDPRYLLEIIRAQVLSPANIDHRAVQEAKRKAAEKEIAGKLKWGLRRLTVSRLIKQARNNAGTREMGKSVLVKPFEVSRMFFQELGRRLVERGVLDEQADVYHCAWHELSAILAGYSDGSGLKILAGIGVAAGRASGRARLICHPGENTRLQAGDVLVAPSTDPGWTPLFLRANALVMEVGGSLSHGAVVAREYGIPAVVNVPGVMKSLKDGETLTVDGDEGKVYRTKQE